MEDLNTNAKEVKVKRTRKARSVEPMAEMEALDVMPRATSEKVGDKEKPQIKSALAAMPLDFVTAADLLKEAHPINDRNKSGKKAGGLVVDESFHIHVAKGDATSADWYDIVAKTNTTPTGGTVSTTQSIGDGRRKQVHTPIVAGPLPIVNRAHLEDGTHPINNSNLSGKKLGAAVLDENFNLYVAMGSDWDSVWKGALEATPTGKPVGNVSNITGQKAVSRNSVVTCVDLPVVLASDLAKQSHPINISAVSGKRKGSMVVTEAGDICVAKGHKPSDVWLKHSNGADLSPLGE